MIQPVARPKWNPRTATAEQRKAIAAALRARQHAEQAEAQVWNAVADAIQQGVPATYMADQFGINRATLYRHVPGITDETDREG
jgi:DNA invertase Pin-like site-specific DNA recombinase